MRHTKIVCTVGPACSGRDVMRQMIATGLNVARLNFSHGTFESHRELLDTIRSLSAELDKPVAILVDVCGPKIRVGALPDGPVHLTVGQEVTILPQPSATGPATISCTYPAITSDLKTGDRIKINDGAVGLVATSVAPDKIVATVEHGEEIGPNKGINLPGVDVSAPSVTDRDREVIEWAVANEADWLALSFVRRDDDVAEVQRILAAHDSPIGVIAKIERPEAVEQIEAIVQQADGIMVARGDLGVEMPVEEVPLIQKRIIDLCNRLDKPVITATQMLESMTHHFMATRAEVSDVSNAILDGTDAVMLSGETAVGRYPVAAVRTMATIAERAEAHLKQEESRRRGRQTDIFASAEAICNGARIIQEQLDIALIVAFTNSGSTALHMSKARPRVPILSPTTSERTLRKMCLFYGVIPVAIEPYDDSEELFQRGEAIAREKQLIQNADSMLFVAGIPLGKTGGTNMLRIHNVADSAGPGRSPDGGDAR